VSNSNEVFWLKVSAGHGSGNNRWRKRIVLCRWQYLSFAYPQFTVPIHLNDVSCTVKSPASSSPPLKS